MQKYVFKQNKWVYCEKTNHKRPKRAGGPSFARARFGHFIFTESQMVEEI
jgi:hypothetical protein